MELKIARRIARLSRQELAHRAGLDITVIARIETNPAVVDTMPYRDVVHLAQVLGVTPTTLFPVAPLIPVLPRLVADEDPAPFDATAEDQE